MLLGLINSAWVQAGQPVEFGLRKTKELGFDCIDIFVDPLELDVRERRLIASECRRLQLPIVSLPCVALGLIDPFGSVRAFHERRVMSYLDLTYEYEAKNLLLVLGEYVWNREVIPAAEQWQWAVQSLQRLGRRATQLGIEIVLELEPFHNSLLNNVDRMVQFLSDVNEPSVKANIDVSHLVLSHCAPEELRKLRGKAGHVHLSDCDGRIHGDLPPGRGVVPFEPYLREIKALEIDGAISIELEYAPQPERIVEWVTEAYEQTNRLMQAAGLRG